MGKIIISENVSLDGVVQDPTGEEGFRLGGWFGHVGDRDREAWVKVELDEALGAGALLLGRRSDEWFATRWLGLPRQLFLRRRYAAAAALGGHRNRRATAHALFRRRWPANLGDRAGSVAKVRDQPVVVGYLVLAGCADTEQRTVDRVSHAMAPWPGGKDVVEAPVRVQADDSEGIAVGPGIAG